MFKMDNFMLYVFYFNTKNGNKACQTPIAPRAQGPTEAEKGAA